MSRGLSGVPGNDTIIYIFYHPFCPLRSGNYFTWFLSWVRTYPGSLFLLASEMQSLITDTSTQMWCPLLVQWQFKDIQYNHQSVASISNVVIHAIVHSSLLSMVSFWALLVWVLLSTWSKGDNSDEHLHVILIDVYWLPLLERFMKRQFRYLRCTSSVNYQNGIRTIDAPKKIHPSLSLRTEISVSTSHSAHHFIVNYSQRNDCPEYLFCSSKAYTPTGLFVVRKRQGDLAFKSLN